MMKRSLVDFARTLPAMAWLPLITAGGILATAWTASAESVHPGGHAEIRIGGHIGHIASRFGVGQSFGDHGHHRDYRLPNRRYPRYRFGPRYPHHGSQLGYRHGYHFRRYRDGYDLDVHHWYPRSRSLGRYYDRDGGFRDCEGFDGFYDFDRYRGLRYRYRPRSRQYHSNPGRDRWRGRRSIPRPTPRRWSNRADSRRRRLAGPKLGDQWTERSGGQGSSRARRLGDGDQWTNKLNDRLRRRRRGSKRVDPRSKSEAVKRRLHDRGRTDHLDK